MSLLFLNIAFASKEQLLFFALFFLSSYRDMNTYIVASIE